MKVERHRYGNVVILKLVGEFDTFNLPAFSKRIDRMVAAGDRRFIFDLPLLKFINSAALGYLIRLSKRLQGKGGELVLAQPSKFMRKTLMTLGLDDVFHVVTSVEAGAEHLAPGESLGEIALGGGENVEMLAGRVPILFRPSGHEEADALPNRVGRIVRLHEEGLLLHYESEAADDPVLAFLVVGQALKLRFRQPFTVEERFFDLTGTIEESSTTGSDEDLCLMIDVRYDDLRPEDRDRLRPLLGDGGAGGAGVLARLRPRPPDDAGHATPDADEGA